MPKKYGFCYVFWLCNVGVNINKLVSNCSDGNKTNRESQLLQYFSYLAVV